MKEDIVGMLSNLGAIDEQHAVSITVLANSWQLANIELDKELKELDALGYVRIIDSNCFLTEAGLVRALSGLS